MSPANTTTPIARGVDSKSSDWRVATTTVAIVQKKPAQKKKGPTNGMNEKIDSIPGV